MTDSIRIRGARTHNLKNLSSSCRATRSSSITGLSGSGKSSLAFDTLYAEGQRRYVESLSAYARQFLQLMEKPDVDLIEGLSPAIAIEQKAASHNPRSTVGTVTEIHDYLRLLFARAGTPYCPEHGLALQAQTRGADGRPRARAAARTRASWSSPRWSPAAQGRAGRAAGGAARAGLHARAHRRQACTSSTLRRAWRRTPSTPSRSWSTACARAPTPSSASPSRFETALRHADGRALVVEVDTGGEHLFSAKFACPVVRLLAARARAAAVLVQQSHGRLPALRRPGRGRVLRSEARRRPSQPVARGRRDPRLGPAQPLLLLDAAVARAALRLRRRAALGDARRSASRSVVLHGSGEREDRLPLSGRARPRAP